MNKSKLNKLVNDLSDKDFEYGKNDCFTFTNALVKAYHSKDYLKLHSGYTNEAEAGIEALTTGTLGYSRNPELCAEGDVVSAEVAPEEIALGFVAGKYALFKMESRVIKLPLKKCRMGWRIN